MVPRRLSIDEAFAKHIQINNSNKSAKTGTSAKTKTTKTKTRAPKDMNELI